MTQSVLFATPDSDITPVTEGAAVELLCTPTHVKGRISEMAFMLEATLRGWDVCAPAAGVDDYDFIVKRKSLRPVVVQVKRSTRLILKNSHMYSIRAANPKRLYSEEAFDVLANHLPDVDMWVFFTRAELGDRKKTTYTLPKDRKQATKCSAPAAREPDNWSLLDDVAQSLTTSGPTPADV